MIKKANIIPEEIHLFHIETIESKILNPSIEKEVTFNLNIGHHVMHNLELERIKMDIAVDIMEDSPKEKKAEASFKFEFHFQIDHLSNFYELNEQKKPIFHALLIATLLGISFSTARGIIFEKLNHTQMKHIILPVVSPQKMMEQKKADN